MFVVLDELPAHAYVILGRRAVITVGSVGQPRDNNAKACYAVLHRDRVTWRRVPYDIRKTVDKIRAQPKLAPPPPSASTPGAGPGRAQSVGCYTKQKAGGAKPMAPRQNAQRPHAACDSPPNV